MQKFYGKIKKTRLGKILRGTVLSGKSIDLPKTIYIFWDTGIDIAPEICKFCAESWKLHNPNWKVIILNKDIAENILPRSAFPPDMAVSHYSDLLRIKLLATHGGVWVDSTCLCTKPLDDWLPMVFAQTEFFAFHRPGEDREVSSWFLAASPGAIIPQVWLKNSLAFWQGRTKLPRAYFWFHYMFEYSIWTSLRFRKAWKDVPKLSATPPHRLQRTLVRNALTVEDLEVIKYTPVHKLCYKRKFSLDDTKSSIRKIWGNECELLKINI
ncbi:capsular polysaccharide synthesis protein [Roseibium sp. LAB1]